MTFDPDFPPPPSVVALSAPDAMTCAYVMLERFSRHDPQAVAWAAYDWLSINEAGLPTVDLLDNRARDDARFWAETATPPELECYAFAAVDRLSGMGGGHALFASRQIKRLAAGLFRRMSPAERVAFKKWIEGVGDDRGDGK